MRRPFSSLALSISVLAACATATPSPRVAAADPCGQFPSAMIEAPMLSSPFTVASVAPVTRRVGRVQTGTVVGARISLFAEPSLSRPGATALLACRRSHGASGSDPLASPDYHLAIDATATGYELRITSPRPSKGHEILDHALAALR